MWQAEIIEYLKSNKAMAGSLLLSNKLNDAINFHVDDMTALDRLGKPDQGLIKYPFPYESVLYTGNIKSDKYAVFMTPEDNRYLIFSFQNAERSGWKMYPVFGMIQKGTNLINCSLLPGATIPYDISKSIIDLSVHICFMINKILTCKNSYQETIERSFDSNQKRIRKGKLSLFSYKIIKIKSSGYYRDQILGKPDDPINHNRLHLCRGHFKEYSSARPLFGKVTGLFWWQPSIRGKNKDGFVDKDYEIQT